MLQTSASLVVFRTPAAELLQLMQTLQKSTAVWVLVDNSGDQGEQAVSREEATKVYGGIYFRSDRNVGFGAGHNLGLAHLRDLGLAQKYHLIVNPDIAFDASVLSKLAEVMDLRPEIGWVMPQVRSLDGSIQPLCKLLPTPFDLIFRRFLPRFICNLFPEWQNNYEMHGAYEAASTDIPFLSGCFVFARESLLHKLGGFDPRYFMYMEDVDLCRRFREHAGMLYWPEVTVTHGHHRGSYHDVRLMLYHVRSALRYFQRWGWFADEQRDAINRHALRSLKRGPHFQYGKGLGLEIKSGERVAERHSTPAHR